MEFNTKSAFAENYLFESRKGYVALATYGRVALILGTNRVIECDVKC